MTMDERVEAALLAGQIAFAEEVFGKGSYSFADGFSEEWKERFNGIWRKVFDAGLRAGLAELSGDKPGWIAPWEATEEMRGAMADQMGSRAEWAAARDTYLGKGDGG